MRCLTKDRVFHMDLVRSACTGLPIYSDQPITQIGLGLQHLKENPLVVQTQAWEESAIVHGLGLGYAIETTGLTESIDAGWHTYGPAINVSGVDRLTPEELFKRLPGGSRAPSRAMLALLMQLIRVSWMKQNFKGAPFPGKLLLSSEVSAQGHPYVLAWKNPDNIRSGQIVCDTRALNINERNLLLVPYYSPVA